MKGQIGASVYEAKEQSDVEEKRENEEQDIVTRWDGTVFGMCDYTKCLNTYPDFDVIDPLSGTNDRSSDQRRKRV